MPISSDQYVLSAANLQFAISKTERENSLISLSDFRVWQEFSHSCSGQIELTRAEEQSSNYTEEFALIYPSTVLVTILHPHKFSSFTVVHANSAWEWMRCWLRSLPELLLTLLTSFLLSLSFCSSHLIEAWGDLGVHSRKVVLFFIPYWTISAAFLYARMKRKKTVQATVNGDLT